MTGLLAVGSNAMAATPAEMKAIVQAGTGGPEVMHYQTVPVPQPAAGQVLVRIYAAAVNPEDWKQRAGITGVPGREPGVEGPPTATPATPENTRIAGTDVAGVIEKPGPGVTQFRVGDAVFAPMNRGGPGVLNGAYAQFGIAAVGKVVRKPRNLSFAQASGLGTATSIGVRAVMIAAVSPGQRVLVTGAAGGVGSAAVQAARGRGARVIGTAAAKHTDYLKRLGIDEVVDDQQGDWSGGVRDIDVLIDTAAARNAQFALRTVKKGGRLIKISGRPDIGGLCGRGHRVPVIPARARGCPGSGRCGHGRSRSPGRGRQPDGERRCDVSAGAGLRGPGRESQRRHAGQDRADRRCGQRRQEVKSSPAQAPAQRERSAGATQALAAGYRAGWNSRGSRSINATRQNAHSWM